MKPLPEETYKDWCHRVQMFEQGHAMMQIAQGKDPDVVLETMSRRIMDKLLHPIFKAIRERFAPCGFIGRAKGENSIVTNGSRAEIDKRNNCFLCVFK